MERIYDQAKDQNVAALVIYAKGTADNKAYSDSKCTVQMKTSELQDAFIKRALVKVDSDYFAPISFTMGDGVGTVTYSKAGTTAGSAATIALAGVAD